MTPVEHLVLYRSDECPFTVPATAAAARSRHHNNDNDLGGNSASEAKHIAFFKMMQDSFHPTHFISLNSLALTIVAGLSMLLGGKNDCSKIMHIK